MVTDQKPAEEDVAAYIRSSTDKQTDQHQIDDIHAWAERNGIDPSDIDEFADYAQSGTVPGRDQFVALTDEIRAVIMTG